MTEHQVVMIDEVSRLANAARASNAPQEVAERVRALSAQARALLDGHTWPGPYAVEQLAPPGDGMLVWEPGDLRKTIPYSPILGELNPIAGEAKLWADGTAVRGTLTARPIHAGPIGTVHGGIVAAILGRAQQPRCLGVRCCRLHPDVDSDLPAAHSTGRGIGAVVPDVRPYRQCLLDLH